MPELAPLARARDLAAFIEAAPSPFHATAEAARRLGAAGFRPVDPAGPWPEEPGGFYLRRAGALVAWRSAPRAGATDGFRIVGAHTDSPNLRLKPRPDTGAAGFRQLGVEVYGGALWNSWLDRDLGLSGRLTVTGPDGVRSVLVRIDRPLARIPQLAIHLDRGVNDTGLKLNPQLHLVPVWGVGPAGAGDLLAFVADAAGVDPAAVAGHDLMLHDLTPPALLGADEALLSAPRIDNLLSCWAAVEALVGGPDAGPTGVVTLFDHEEVGSETAAGAGSPLLPTVLERIVLARGGGREELHRALAGSICVSADGAHATHPNYLDRHEPGHRIAINAGPVLKHNSNARYATDAESAAVFRTAAAAAGVPVQDFVVRSDLPCGSTIGPITAARLGIPVVDVGVAQLSMHSARELCGSADPAWFVDALAAFLADRR